MIDRQNIVQRAIRSNYLGDRDSFIDTQTLVFDTCEIRLKDSVEALRLMHRMDEAKRKACGTFRISIDFPVNGWRIHGERKTKK